MKSLKMGKRPKRAKGGRLVMVDGRRIKCKAAKQRGKAR